MGITMIQAERMLKALVEEGWFEKSKKAFYSLSPRALMELRGWLIETYNELDEDEEEDEEERMLRIKLCYACKEIITVVRAVRAYSERNLAKRTTAGSALPETVLPMSTS